MTVEYMCGMRKAAIEDGMDVANRPTVTSGGYYVENWDKEAHCIRLKASPYFFGGEAPIKDVLFIFGRAIPRRYRHPAEWTALQVLEPN